MTDQESNAIIAKAASADEKWGEWATEPCPSGQVRLAGCIPWMDHFRCGCCHGAKRIPRDFGSPENTLKLVRWAKAQHFWKDEADYRVLIDAFFDLCFEMSVDEIRTALRIRDIIAERLKEIADGDT